MNTTIHPEGKYAGIIWILSSVSLIIYALLSLQNQNIPGMKELIDFLSDVDGLYIYVAAFITILIEGLYIVGSFFPGSTILVLLSILSQVGGVAPFVFTILAVFLGWCVAGIINIACAKIYGAKILQKSHNPAYQVTDRPWTTWFPAFRANYEVAQIAEGGDPYKVLLSSIRVKFFVSLFMLGSLALLPLFLDIHELGNEEGIISVLAVAGISFMVGIFKIRKYLIQQKGF
jgi:hypothetical protein